MTAINALVLQGGGALGSYQVGVYQALEEHGFLPDLVVGISIGAINSAIIAGNLPENRLERLNEFWLRITYDTGGEKIVDPELLKLHNQYNSKLALMYGQHGFFAPKLINPWWLNDTEPENLAFYDTSPLKKTLLELVDFDYLNSSHSPRLSVGAVDMESGDFTFFDNQEIEILPEHIMASGALPPGFPPIKIKDRYYLDGGVFLNTPMARVFELYDSQRRHSSGATVLCFMVDLFSVAGSKPKDMDGMLERLKDIQYSSRTKRMVSLYAQLQETRYNIQQVSTLFTDEQKKHPAIAALLNRSCSTHLDIIHLICKSESGFELSSKDYEFSKASYLKRAKLGLHDTKAMIEKYATQWLKDPASGGVDIYTL
ncbi:MAG: patatin-like phospholipase family protein [Burkholderiales bacterium]